MAAPASIIPIGDGIIVLRHNGSSAGRLSPGRGRYRAAPAT